MEPDKHFPNDIKSIILQQQAWPMSFQGTFGNKNTLSLGHSEIANRINYLVTIEMNI